MPDRRRRWDVLAVVAAGGALGSLARWALGEAVPHAPDRIPVSTWVENVSGALLLGLLMVYVVEVWPPRRYLRPFLGVGVLGGYTTFSTYMLDTRTLLASGEPGRAAAYLLGTLLTGLLAAWAGLVLGRLSVSLARQRASRRRDRPPPPARTER